MVFELLIKPIVFVDIEKAAEYYENQLDGLGKLFYNQFLASLGDIQNQPLTYSYVKDPVRRCKIKSFPYKIFYLISDDTIFILGFAHSKKEQCFCKKETETNVNILLSVIARNEAI